MIIMLIKADNTTVLAPDYSWVPANLGRFIGGIQAICIVVLVIAVIAGVLRFVLARVTTTRVDDAIGDRVLISVIVACFLLLVWVSSWAIRWERGILMCRRIL